MKTFRRGQKIARYDGLPATFVRYTPITGRIVVSYDDDTTPERVAYEGDFRARDASQPAGQRKGDE